MMRIINYSMKTKIKLELKKKIGCERAKREKNGP